MPEHSQPYAEPTYQTATISNTESLSSAIELHPAHYAFAIGMPATWTAANLTFQVSHDGTTWKNLYDDEGNEVTVTAAASRMIRLYPEEWAAFKHLKIRSGTSGSAVAQGGDRTLIVLTRPI
jgi:hypothetical protein